MGAWPGLIMPGEPGKPGKPGQSAGSFKVCQADQLKPYLMTWPGLTLPDMPLSILATCLSYVSLYLYLEQILVDSCHPRLEGFEAVTIFA